MAHVPREPALDAALRLHASEWRRHEAIYKHDQDAERVKGAEDNERVLSYAQRDTSCIPARTLSLPDDDFRLFSYRSARSTPFVIGISLAIFIETAALHTLLIFRHPIIAWSLTTLSVLAIVWLVRDYRALRYGRGRLQTDTMIFSICRRSHLR